VENMQGRGMEGGGRRKVNYPRLKWISNPWYGMLEWSYRRWFFCEHPPLRRG